MGLVLGLVLVITVGRLLMLWWWRAPQAPASPPPLET
jgi:hypothetical protein